MHPAVLFCNIAVLRCCGLDITVSQLLCDNSPISFHSLMLILKNWQVTVPLMKKISAKITRTQRFLCLCVLSILYCSLAFLRCSFSSLYACLLVQVAPKSSLPFIISIVSSKNFICSQNI